MTPRRMAQGAVDDDEDEKVANGRGNSGGDNVTRKVFSTSRLAEFASISELEKQTGQPVANWLLVVLKEAGR